MWDSVDAIDVDMQPVEGNRPAFIVLYIFIIIILCLLFINLFVAIVIETFNKEKQFMNPFIEDEQRIWFLLQLETYNAKP